MTKKLEINLIPKVDDSGSTYWTASYPAVKAVVGSGATPEEAIAEAEENLEFYLECIDTEIEEYKEVEYSGKIVLRLPKSIHQKTALLAKEDGVSLNTYLNTAIATYIGKRELADSIEKSLDEKIAKVIVGTKAYAEDGGASDFSNNTESETSNVIMLVNDYTNSWAKQM